MGNKMEDDDIIISTIEELKKLSRTEAKRYIQQLKIISVYLEKFKKLKDCDIDYIYHRLCHHYRDMALAEIISFFLSEFISPRPRLNPCNPREKLLWPLGIRPVFKFCKQLREVKRTTFYNQLRNGLENGIFLKFTIKKGKLGHKTLFTINQETAELVYNWTQQRNR